MGNNFTKTFEKYHNKIFPIVWFIAMFGVLGFIALGAMSIFYYIDEMSTTVQSGSAPMVVEVTLILYLVGMIVLPVVLLYVRIFMVFKMPGGNSSGDGTLRTRPTPKV